jgi:hypothetical protein
MSRYRSLLGGVPRVGSPASSLVSRHSDFSGSRRRSLLASPCRSGSRRGPRDLPSSWVTLVHVRRTKTPVEERRPGPRAGCPAFRSSLCCLPRRSPRRPPRGCGSRGSIPPPAHPLSTTLNPPTVQARDRLLSVFLLRDVRLAHSRGSLRLRSRHGTLLSDCACALSKKGRCYGRTRRLGTSFRSFDSSSSSSPADAVR